MKEDGAKPSSDKLQNIMQLRVARVSLERIDIESDSASAVSMHSVGSGSGSECARKKFWSRKRSWERNTAASDSEKDESAPDRKVSAGKASRGRGRPPSTGEYVGKAKAQAAFRKAKSELEREELRLAAEKEIVDLTAQARSTRTSAEVRIATKQAIEENETIDGLLKRVQTGIDLVQKVEKKSGRLQGPMQAALKEAVVMIKAATNTLATRTVTEEIHDLQAQNDVLRAEIDEMRKEMAELKARLRAKAPTNVTSNETPPCNMEELASHILSVTTARINARIEGLESRLNPEPRLRPALAFERRQKEAPLQPPPQIVTSHTQPETPRETEKRRSHPAAQNIPAPRANEAPKGKAKKKKGKKNKKAEVAPVETAPPVPRTLPPAPASMSEGWSTVVKKGKTNGDKGKKAPSKGPKRTAQPAQIKTRPPRSAAVVLSIQPGATEKGVTYEKAIGEAKRRIDIGELGIEAVRFRRAITGATIIEVPGATSDGKADALADKLKGIFKDDEVRVSRPVKCSEIRVSGLDDSVTAEEVAAAVAKLGDCSVDNVKVGTPRRDHTGLLAVYVRCPTAAAKSVLEGRLLVGWVAARVRLLPNRDLRCFRCLEAGHVQAVCPAQVDRSRQCFRCGQLGHIAAQCSNDPHCSLCATTDRPAGHRVGSKACKAPATKIGRRAAASARKSQPMSSQPAPGHEEVQMTGD
ncbi:uncharacterized protein LOC135085606 [Ostrinia nubilalis]|uniref:uncharacterized protein LOC135085606 n=1 Tax=Ostrinia nubilalis TaxID=29057 RepID=UPI0030826145